MLVCIPTKGYIQAYLILGAYLQEEKDLINLHAIVQYWQMLCLWHMHGPRDTDM